MTITDAGEVSVGRLSPARVRPTRRAQGFGEQWRAVAAVLTGRGQEPDAG